MRSVLLGGVMIVLGTAAGCQPQQKPPQAASVRPTALDVTAPAASSTPTYHPAAMMPAVTPPAEPAISQTPVTAAAPGGAGGSYTVRKGDTLFRIAKDKYGDGKQWQRIASANPGVSPSTLRVGQTLAIPQ